MKSTDEYLLTSTVSVGDVKMWIVEKSENAKRELISLISHRFQNRYLKHLKEINSGFLKMAISCLMIETLESFKQGKKDTKNIGAQMFKSFFETEKEYFAGFSDISADFYSNVRCGILHQAETANAWRILLKGEMLDGEEKVINANLFVDALGKSLKKYIGNLQERGFDDKIWESVFIKLEGICENCEIKP